MNLIARQTPTPYEIIIPGAIAFFFAIIIGYSDIILFDAYVGTGIEICYSDNQSEECNIIRQKSGACKTCQIEIGEQYWQLQKLQAYSVGIALFFIKFAIVVGTQGWAKLTGSVMFTAFLWGFTAFGLFMFGVVDLLYYELRPDIVKPQQLPWLNDSGVFEYTKAFGNPDVVDYSDLYITFAMGIGIIAGAWFFMIKESRKVNQKIRTLRY